MASPLAAQQTLPLESIIAAKSVREFTRLGAAGLVAPDIMADLVGMRLDEINGRWSMTFNADGTISYSGNMQSAAPHSWRLAGNVSDPDDRYLLCLGTFRGSECARVFRIGNVLRFTAQPQGDNGYALSPWIVQIAPMMAPGD